MTIEAELGDQLEDVVDALVTSGRFRSKNDVLREGVRLVREQELQLVDLDKALARGIADADAGRTRAASDVFDDLVSKHENDARNQR